jgi:hypothetical protein
VESRTNDNLWSSDVVAADDPGRQSPVAGLLPESTVSAFAGVGYRETEIG